MKLIYVTGDDDYGALSWEETNQSPKDAWDLAMRLGGTFTDVDLFSNSENNFEVTAHEFKDVDPKFIDFIRNMQDYDDSKHYNFYIVEE